MLKSEILVELGLREQLMRISLDYSQVEFLVKELAARLVDELGLSKLHAAHYAAIPRGGQIVLGMLSYILALERSRLESPNPESLLIIVDDCSISGLRFGETLKSYPNEQVVFAPLCSAPALRRAVLEQEPRVTACIAAMDLFDMARDLYPDPADHQKWVSLCNKQPGKHRYFRGIVQPVIFPWNEPDLNLHSPSNQEIRDIWRLQPPDACLKNWGRLGLPPVKKLRPFIRCNPHVAHALIEDEVVLCHRHTHQAFRLQGREADMWRALAAYGDLEKAVAWLSMHSKEPPSALYHDLEVFMKTWLDRTVFETIKA